MRKRSPESRRVRILLTIHHPLDPDAGAPGATLDLGRALRELGHDVEFASHDDMPARLGPRARELLFPEWLAARLRSIQQTRPVDVVDASTGDTWAWSRIAPRLSSPRPLVAVRSHGLEHVFWDQAEREAREGGEPLTRLTRIYHGRVRLREVAAALRSADVALFLNAGDRRHAVERLGVAADRAQVVANGLPPSLIGLPFDPLAPDAPVRIAQVGTYAERKGIRFGAPALNALLRRHPDLSVTFVGAGRDPGAVHEDFDAEVRDRVEVIPRYARAHLPDLLRGHHIKLFPSLAEGFSVALIEAMACGLAPVASARVASPLVEDGRNGLLVPQRDPRALEDAVDRLLADRALLDRLRAAAHESAQDYGWDRIARETAAIYESYLDQ